MPLSEQEQRLLDEMERNLLHHEADVVSAGGGGRPFSYRNLVYGALLVVVGLVGLVVGVSLYQRLEGAAYVGIIVGVVGFCAMFGGVVLAMRRGKGAPTELGATSDRPRSGAPTGAPGFMDRMNERWDRRHEGE